MEAAEIRINNICLQKYQDVTKHGKSVFKANKVTWRDIGWCVQYPDNYKGLPLDDNILKMAGFDATAGTIQNDKYNREYFHPDFPFVLIRAKDSWRYNPNCFNLEELATKPSLKFILPSELKFLHQLQNAFYIFTGKELEIEL